MSKKIHLVCWCFLLLVLLCDASWQGVDIIVFPESSLSISTSSDPAVARTEAASFIPHPADNVVPCDQSHAFSYSLRALSCAARDRNMYVVANHREKYICTAQKGCPRDNLLVYNTNVVFDRRGAVVARYRKYNLFGEAGTNRTRRAEPSTFATDFGVTFGQFVCFDLLFAEPALNYTQDRMTTTTTRINDVIFSNHWFSELPFLYGVAAQAAWAYANDVNFLSAGYNYPVTASGGTRWFYSLHILSMWFYNEKLISGSGIYLGRDGYVDVISEKRVSNVLVISNVPKIIDGKRASNVDLQNIVIRLNEKEMPRENVSTSTYRHVNDYLKPYTSVLIDPEKGYFNRTICNREFCCFFNVSMTYDDKNIDPNTNSSFYRYRVAVFNGTRTFTGVAKGGVKVCGIISCLDDSLETCGQLLNDDDDDLPEKAMLFRSILIRASVERAAAHDLFVMPITLTKRMLPMNASDFHYEAREARNARVVHEMRTRSPSRDLLTFAIYARYFVNDDKDVTTDAATRNALESILLTVLMYALVKFVQ
ncbi:unnamed protein product [Trichogramma brassicae]|uniref:CN hydrolase domain-containing protein n=1 Tax=Trichogramma brassicae TaxID=86971 RepID=A0A6H5IPK8_9HYME|nr:unnamed protein product [Trichogramma brassicae]